MASNDHLISTFRDNAQAYCDFIDEWRAGPVAEPYATLLRLLTNLAKGGLELPHLATADVTDIDRMDHEGWMIVFAEIGRAIAESEADIFRLHEADDPDFIRAQMLDDDLADIYRDLRHGLDHYAVGSPEHISEAVWQWRFGYESHWGPHLLNALRTVHDIHFRLQCD